MDYIRYISQSSESLLKYVRLNPFKNNPGWGKSSDKANNIWNEEIHFIGAVRIPNKAWIGNGGKELWKDRYQFESISIRPCDENGQSILDENKKPVELHIYANALQSTYNEWSSKVDNGKITEKNKERFDGYVAQKMLRDPSFKKEIEKQNVRYFSTEDLNNVKAVFVSNGLAIMQIGLDSKDNSLKSLLPGDYAFVIGRENSFSRDENEINYLNSLGNAEFLMAIEKQENEMAMYLTLKIHTDKGLIQHSSFFRSGKVASAGMLRVDDSGKIKTIVQHSGHYLPTHEETAAALRFLQSNLNPDYFGSLACSTNQYSGLLMKATMAINAVAKKVLNWDIGIGMSGVNADKWLKNYNSSHNIIS